jgi:hypothetical protein
MNTPDKPAATEQSNQSGGSPSPSATGSAIPNEERNFRWAYALLVELAKVCLDKANAEAKPGYWPAQQEWHELSSSSKATFLREARELAKIPLDEFLEGIRSGAYDVDDLFDSPNIGDQPTFFGSQS